MTEELRDVGKTNTQVHRKAAVRWTGLSDQLSAAPQRLGMFIIYS